MNSRKDFEKSFSELSVISEEEKTFKGDITWLIPLQEVCKYNEKVGIFCTSKYAEIESNWFYMGSSGISFYLRIHPTENDMVFFTLPPTFKKEYTNDPARISIIFHKKFPYNAWIKGKIYTHTDLGSATKCTTTFSSSAKDFDKEIDLEFQHNIFVKNYYRFTGCLFLIIRCSMEISTKEIKCAFDSEKAVCVESRDYNSNKEIIKHDSFSDVKIQIDDRLFATHKTILGRIPYFQELFDTNELERCFELTDIGPEIFNHILTFLYSGDIPELNFRLACELYIVASDLKVHDLQFLCSSYLGANLSVENVFMVLKFSNEYEDIDLKKECLKFIKKADVEALAENSVIL